jgi:uncharacterized protein (DUF983 family)
MPAISQRIPKEEIYKALSPAIVFADLKPEQTNGKFVCRCPRCKKSNFIAEQSAVGKGKCSACGYSISYWDHIKQRENLDNKAVIKRLVELSETQGSPMPQPETPPALQSKPEEPPKSEAKPIAEKPQNAQHIEVYSQFVKVVGRKCLVSGTDYASNARDLVKKNGFNMSEYEALDFCLHPGNDYLKNYFSKRRIPVEVLSESRIIGDVDLRGTVMIPVKEKGKIVDFVLLFQNGGQGETYMNAGAVQTRIFGKDTAFEGVKNTETAIVTGSALDACYLSVQNFTNVVSFPDEIISDDQIAWLQEAGAKDVVLCKSASFESTKESIIKLHAKGFYVSKITLPGKAQSAITYMQSNGKDAFDKLLRKAMSGWAWIAQGTVVNIRSSHHGIGDNALREKALAKAAVIVDIIHDTIYLMDFLKQLAVEIGVPVKDLKARFSTEKQGVDEGVGVAIPVAADGAVALEQAPASKPLTVLVKEIAAETKKVAKEQQKQQKEATKQQQVAALNAFIGEFVAQAEQLLALPAFDKIEYLALMAIQTYPCPNCPEGANFKGFLAELKKKALRHEYSYIRRMLHFQKSLLSK